ncbi:hypothetical protein PG997_011349 [Apiospora hydei]|uniref:Uncharacterized protein n=1 Tax=Apiospora hydei TaxID=1337664 RepID=A0ABR1VIT2_9PEZI
MGSYAGNTKGPPDEPAPWNWNGGSDLTGPRAYEVLIDRFSSLARSCESAFAMQLASMATFRFETVANTEIMPNHSQAHQIDSSPDVDNAKSMVPAAPQPVATVTRKRVT